MYGGTFSQQPFGAPQAAMAGMYQTPAHQQFAQKQQQQFAPPQYGQRQPQLRPQPLQQRPAPQPIQRMQSAPGLQNQAYQQQAQRVQQNANAIQQAQRKPRPLGAGAGAAAAAQGIQSPTAPINQIQRTTMARI